MRRDDQERDGFIRRVRESLEASETRLEADTLDRLRVARRQAVAHATRSRAQAVARERSAWWRRGFTGDGWLMPAGAFASVVATVLAIALLVRGPDAGSLDEVTDLELLTASEELELFENLEFYRWLPDTEQAG